MEGWVRLGEGPESKVADEGLGCAWRQILHRWPQILCAGSTRTAFLPPRTPFPLCATAHVCRRILHKCLREGSAPVPRTCAAMDVHSTTNIQSSAQ